MEREQEQPWMELVRELVPLMQVLVRGLEQVS
jgi:hypothetical protein